MIKLHNVSKTFNNKDDILKPISLEIEDKKILGIVGENGAGKTTLIKIMTGLVIPSSGTVFYDNELLCHKTLREIYRKISIVLDGGRSVQWRLTAKDNFYYYSTLKDVKDNEIKKNIEKYKKMFKINELIDKKVNDMSLGQKQLIAIVTALISNCKYMFLDEPTNGLDLETKCNLVEVLKKIKQDEDHTIVITTHDLEFLLSVADECVVMDRGKIIKSINLDNEKFESSYKYYKDSFLGLEK